MADTTDSKDFGKRPETDDNALQPQSATPATTGDVVQMENVNNNNQPDPDAAPSSTTTQSQHKGAQEEPPIPTTATGANNNHMPNMPISSQDVMSETDPVAPASLIVQPDTDSISQASQQSASCPTSANTTEAPVCNITLLLPTGARHPYKIDDKYLSKRGVEIPETVQQTGQPDPFSISVYKLKELILREWREEWEGKPASPTSIRLIHFGKLLDDKESLKSEFYPFLFDDG
ncbi:hypothetical protein QBC32DRAFT_347796 [Pseudoneurospora amorphoporcata]|uniref:UBL3-like ubiquitin domain-containing protein n=1 Tax=Pseudoneurospora amorphoporcata TaxID=241081 RepID=A0AAN6SDV5_9PEZI|nr:hypothetical protein QBC32DRAFT_347796 [Pseudoneurospora amorphoporcata]